MKKSKSAGLTRREFVRRVGAALMSCYVIWKFSENVEAAKQFLVDLVGNFAAVFRESEFYNLPCYPSTVPDLAGQIASDPEAQPSGKYKVLGTALDWSTNIGFPGYATAATDEVFNTFVLPTMFARAARGEATPENAVQAAQAEITRIFERRSALARDLRLQRTGERLGRLRPRSLA